MPTASVAPSPAEQRAGAEADEVTSSVKTPMKPIVHTTDLRAALPSGTVKKRIRMCGSPAVPKKIVRPVEITRAGVVRYRPGPRNFLPSPDSAAALSSSSRRAEVELRHHRDRDDDAGDHQHAALTIWIHVVASMPPKTM